MKRVFLVLVGVMVLLLSCGDDAVVDNDNPNFAPPSFSTWYVPDNYATLQAANDAATVTAGDRIILRAGNHSGAKINKPLDIQGEEGAIIVGQVGISLTVKKGSNGTILSDPSGTSISHLTFDNNHVGIITGNGVYTSPPFYQISNVTIAHCTFLNNFTAIWAWNIDNWTIEHNTIRDLHQSYLTDKYGGSPLDSLPGHGIMLALLYHDYSSTCMENYIGNNLITGTFQANSANSYNAAGISLFYCNPGRGVFVNNQITRNRINMVSSNPELVKFNGISMQLWNFIGSCARRMTNNTIEYNNLNGIPEADQFYLSPDNWYNWSLFNTFWRNLGSDRGFGNGNGSYPGGFEE